MFSIKSTVVSLFIGCAALHAKAFADNQKPSSVGRNRIELAKKSFFPTQEVSFSSSSYHAERTSSFISSWHSLANSFAQCQSIVSQHSSYDVAVQSVNSLYESYQTAFQQYSSCDVCASELYTGGYGSEIEETVPIMFSSFQSIISTCQQVYGVEFERHFAYIFRRMGHFGHFAHHVCRSAGLNLGSLLSNLNLRNDILSGLGINGILGRNAGILNGLLGAKQQSSNQ